VIGAKTVVMGLASVGAVVAAAAFGVFSSERLAAQGPGSLLAAGAFGIVVGTALFRFWRLDEKSARYLRWTTEPSSWDVREAHFFGGDRRRVVLGDNDSGDAFDAPRVVQHTASVVVASVLALSLIDARALEHLVRAQKSATAMTSSYCPDEAPAPKPEPGPDPTAQGCELVRRAYALGYAKTLGACAPKAKVEEEAAARPPCTRRHRDEPVLHYSWRLLASFFASTKAVAGRSYYEKSNEELRLRAKHVGALVDSERRFLTSAPHAAHHIWTNLPDPGDGAFVEATCKERYARLPHRPMPAAGTLRASKVFEHVVGQLLFEERYLAAAGRCREYHVHFGAPRDACKRLAANPQAFLASQGEVLEGIRSVVDGHASA
jgi:hypothetical protein